MFEAIIALLLIGFAVVAIAAAVKRFRNGAPVADPNRLVVGVGHVLVLNGPWLEYQHVYGKGFKVPVSAVQGAMVERAGWGKATLRVVGAGTELARVTDLPVNWAENAQAWIAQKLSEQLEGTATV